jgi:hypothetical protein
MTVVATLLALIAGSVCWAVGFLLWKDTEQASEWDRRSILTLIGSCSGFGAGLFLFYWSAFTVAAMIEG